MWTKVGVVRDGASLAAALGELVEIGERLPRDGTRRALEASNLQQVAVLIARSALAREESRGAHFRTDFPQHDDGRFLRHSVVREDAIGFVQ